MKATVELAEDVEAPVEKGQILGRIRVMREKEEVAVYTITAKAAVERLGFSVSLKRLFAALCS